MLLPLDNVMNLWYTAVPIYEWEAEPTVPPADGCADVAPADAQGNAAEDVQTNMRLVFKGYEWIATPVWTQRDNPAWDLVQGNQRDEDARRVDNGKRQRLQPIDDAATDPIDADTAATAGDDSGPIEPDLDTSPPDADQDRTHW